MNFALEAITDEGYTKNPYRVAKRFQPTDEIVNGVRIPDDQIEQYPEVRTSDAIAVRANYYLPYRAAINAEYKYYTDSWGIEASSYKIGYVHPYKEQWTFDVTYRYYDQDQADFYKDVYAQSETNLLYYGRDKELSTFTSQGYGIGVGYEFLRGGWWNFDKASANFAYEIIDFKYDNFTDYDRDSKNLGKLFRFSAEVVQVYFSIWY